MMGRGRMRSDPLLVAARVMRLRPQQQWDQALEQCTSYPSSALSSFDGPLFKEIPIYFGCGNLSGEIVDLFQILSPTENPPALLMALLAAGLDDKANCFLFFLSFFAVGPFFLLSVDLVHSNPIPSPSPWLKQGLLF